MFLDLFEIVFKEMFVLNDKRKCVGNYSLGWVIGRGVFGMVCFGIYLLSGENVSIILLLVFFLMM